VVCSPALTSSIYASLASSDNWTVGWRDNKIMCKLHIENLLNSYRKPWKALLLLQNMYLFQNKWRLVIPLCQLLFTTMQNLLSGTVLPSFSQANVKLKPSGTTHTQATVT
jgi:hypothetical protein